MTTHDKSAYVQLRALIERGRDRERRRILSLVDGFEYAASISPNGEVTEHTLAALKGAINAR